MMMHFNAQQASSTSKTGKRKNLERGAGGENPEDHVDPEIPFGEKKLL